MIVWPNIQCKILRLEENNKAAFVCIIPKKHMKKYFLYILGCDMNHSDAERIASVFNDLGYTLTTKEEESDVMVAVACSVRQKAIDKMHQEYKSPKQKTWYGLRERIREARPRHK